MKHEIYLLPEDRAYAIARIEELERQIQDLGPDFNDAFTQSSETWHDNSPFEAIRDKQAMLAAELHKLRSLIRSSVLVMPKKERGTIGIGDTVTLSNGARYCIAGDWTPLAGQCSDGVTRVSRYAPLAVVLIGERPGATVRVANKNLGIINVEA